MKIYPISLGCAKNKVDSEVLLGNLINNPDISLTDDFMAADLIFINTCAFIESAKQEAIDTIFEVLDSKTQNQKVMVCGCLSTRYQSEISSLIPEVDRFVAISEYPKLKEIVNSLFTSHPFTGQVDPLNRVITSMKESVYLKISEGCNNRCSYCAIPLIRGRFVSRSREEILLEAQKLVRAGAKELNLISQDTTNYGFDLYQDYGIVELLADLCQINGDFKIRLLYLYPELVTDKLISFIANNAKVMPYFDIPLQHSEDKMLKSMNRRGDKKFIKELIGKIRKNIPNAILRTTMIVGFPGEEEEDFNNLITFIKDMKFDRLGAFSYSAEEGTTGYLMENQIPEDVKASRLDAIYLAQDEIALRQNERHLNTVMDVLITEYDSESYCYLGRSYAFAPDDIDGYVVCYATEELQIGDVVKVKILDASINSLSGQVIFE